MCIVVLGVEGELRRCVCLHLLLAFIDIYFGYLGNEKKEEGDVVGVRLLWVGVTVFLDLAFINLTTES